jgi:uncharacterized protein YicC (UPF0701 family)
MTKAGENKSPHKSNDEKSYHKDLQTHLFKFEHALDAYTKSNGDEKARLKTVMDTHLEIIRPDVSEITTKSIHKLGEKLAKDYHLYVAFHSDENFAALKQDIQTLRECNQIEE